MEDLDEIGTDAIGKVDDEDDFMLLGLKFRFAWSSLPLVLFIWHGFLSLAFFEIDSWMKCFVTSSFLAPQNSHLFRGHFADILRTCSSYNT